MSKFLPITLITIVITITTAKLFAQDIEWQWAKSAGGNDIDLSESVATDSRSNLYVTGGFYSSSITFGTTVLINSGVADLFITKYDSLGNVVWAKSAGGSDYEFANSISVDCKGNAYITGRFTSPSIAVDSIVLTNTGGADIFVVKYDSNGTVVWAKSYGGTDIDAGSGICNDPYGNVYVSGYFWSPFISFGSTILTNANSYYDGFIAKYDSNGNAIWAKSITGSNDDLSMETSADVKGNVYVAGIFNSHSISFDSATIVNSNEYHKEIFLIKCDSNGNVIWSKSIGGAADDEVSTISTDTRGNLYLTGSFYETSLIVDSVTLTSAGVPDMFVIKYGSDGALRWAKSAGGTQTDAGTGVSIDTVGNVYVTGYFMSSSISFDSIALVNADLAGFNSDMFIAKYDSSGNILVVKSSAAANNEFGGDISITAPAKGYLTGVFYGSSIAFGSNILFNAGNVDIFIVNLSSVTTIGIEGVHLDNHVKIFPNPFSSKATVKFNRPLVNATLMLNDVLGKTVKIKINLNDPQITLTRDDLPPGMYFFQVTENCKTTAKGKLVIAD